ncbi:hypothetical protein HC928_15475 [bacterium]|nr:hypothetical protein [bacterium]
MGWCVDRGRQPDSDVVRPLVDVPFTNASLPNDPAFAAPLVAETVALLSLLFRFGAAQGDQPRLWRTSAAVGAGCFITGATVWGAAVVAEPYLPDLAHNTVDHFAVFDQAAMLDASSYAWDLPAGFPVPFVPPRTR